MMEKIKQLIDDNPKLMEVFKFGLVGGLASVLQFLIYNACIYIFAQWILELQASNALPSWALTSCVVISYLVSMVFNFILTTYFTFNVKPNAKRGLGFVFSHMINMGMQIGLVNFFTHVGVAEQWALIPTMCICVPINFLLVRFFVKR